MIADLAQGWPILSVTTFLPLVGALLILLVKGEGEAVEKNIRSIALITTIATFLVSLILWAGFNNATADYQFVEKHAWIGDSITYHMGVDGISILFVILTTFLMPMCILASDVIHTRVKEYMVAFLVLETLMIGVFCALDLVLFYLFFEAGLIPMFLIIGIWGGPRRIYATFKFFLYTLLGSLLMLLAIIAMYLMAGTTDVVALTDFQFPPAMQNWLWLAFFASFAVKVPMWPVHTWLPDAHVEAPTA
ncbi:NADH-quinone oxidoreductase subunit M, partial [Zavarzinia sp.]|uniref:NADH-quinone oxidoreductase subunit M n=1 Tax=Zavarzinia sp. TaxID=2027920 RepID=UPI00356A4BD5